MPETKIGEQRDKSLGGGGDKKGPNVSQSVLEMQKRIMQSQLSPEVIGRFSTMASKAGKKGSLFITTSAYKQIKQLLTAYSAKQGTQPIEWRRVQIGSLDGLLESWFSKEENSGDMSDVGRAKWAAMQWLAPKVKGELRALRGTTIKEEAPESESETETETEEPTSEKAPSEEQQAPKPLPTGYEQNNNNDDDSVASSVESSIEEEVKAKVDVGENVVEEKEAQESEVESSVEEMVKEIAPTDFGSYRPKPPPTAKDKTGYTPMKKDGEVEQQDSESLSVSSLPSEEQGPEYGPEEFKQKETDSSAKYKQISNVRKIHHGEHTAGSSVLKLIFDEVEFAGKLVDEKGKRTGFVDSIMSDNNAQRIYVQDVEDMAGWLEWRWRWSRSTFDKYYRRLLELFGRQLPPESDKEREERLARAEKKHRERQQEEESLVEENSFEFDNEDDEDEGEESSFQFDNEDDEDEDSEEEDSEVAKQDEELEKKEPKVAETGAIKVKAKRTEEERAKYKLRMSGGSMVRGAEKKPFDTAGMSTNRAGAGYAIFVMSSNGDMYAGTHKVGIFHHSSFLAGGATAGAGELKVSGGKIQALTNKSGHYFPSVDENLQVIDELRANGFSPGSYSFLEYADVNGNERVTPYDTAADYIRAKRSQ